MLTIALSSLKGANGQTGPAGEAGPVGQDGEKAVFQVNNGFIEWKYETGTTWTKLLDLSSLNGADGKDGVTPVITINTDGYWVINGVATSYVAVLPSMKYNVTFDAKGGTLPTGASSVLVDVVGGCPILYLFQLNNIISSMVGIQEKELMIANLMRSMLLMKISL
jgi:hypothetical protein